MKGLGSIIRKSRRDGMFLEKNHEITTVKLRKSFKGNLTIDRKAPGLNRKVIGWKPYPSDPEWVRRYRGIRSDR